MSFSSSSHTVNKGHVLKIRRLLLACVDWLLGLKGLGENRRVPEHVEMSLGASVSSHRSLYICVAASGILAFFVGPFL